MLKKKSFFERITGGMRMDEEEKNESDKKQGLAELKRIALDKSSEKSSSKITEEEEEGQLTVDVYQTANDIIVHTMVAGVQPDNLSIIITRDMITIRGKREKNRAIAEDNYFVRELYWGTFSRTISLPEEVDPEEAEAIEKHGLLIIKLPKINKDKQTNLKVKSV